MNERNIRNQKGAAVTGLVLALFFFVMLCGFFSFDSSRIQMAQRELTATCDSASLAGTAMLTGFDVDNDDVNHTKLQNAQASACQYARNMFQAGNLLGGGLGNATVVPTLSAVEAVGAPGTTNFMISLADPQNSYVGVPPGPATCVNGKAIMCYACYAYHPVFLSIVGVNLVGLNASSGGGLPQVDAVVVFDYSGSMDDGTKVSFVRRTWDSTQPPALVSLLNGGLADCQMNGSPYPGAWQAKAGFGVNHYIVIQPTLPSHTLANCLQHDYTENANGLNLNVLPPSNIDLATNPNSQANPPFRWDQRMRTNVIPFVQAANSSGTMLNQQCGLKWNNDFGLPPGNCTLVPPFGYGYFWTPDNKDSKLYKDASVQPLNTALPKAAAMAYRPDAQATNAFPAAGWNGSMPDLTFVQNVPPGAGGLSVYQASDPTNTTTVRSFTDLVVNIATPGPWPYVQPVPQTDDFSTSFTFAFPAQEPDSLLAGQTFTFDDIGVVVEAARGNLDSSQNALGALLDRGGLYSIPNISVLRTKSAVSPAHVAPNYQRAYQRLAMLCSQPIATALDGADGGFFQKINALSDCRFGFVGFSNADLMTISATPNSVSQGTPHGNVQGNPNSFYYSVNYSGAAISNWNFYWNGVTTGAAENTTSVAGGTGTGFRQPRRSLTKTETQAVSLNGVNGCRVNSSMPNGIGVTTGESAAWSSVTTDANGLDNGRPIDHTDTYEAINTARGMFLDDAHYNITNLSKSRPAAKHAIVFFTDGVPTGGPTGTDGSGALSVAKACKSDGIALFTIGLDTTGNSVLQSNQVTFLGNDTSSGLAGAAGNGGRFFQCTSAQACKEAFGAVARRLAQSQR
jgi:hypothetical protein